MPFHLSENIIKGTRMCLSMRTSGPDLEGHFALNEVQIGQLLLEEKDGLVVKALDRDLGNPSFIP